MATSNEKTKKTEKTEDKKKAGGKRAPSPAKAKAQNDLAYAIGEARDHMRQNGGQTVGSVLLTAFSLFVVGVAIVLSLIVGGVLGGVEDQVTIRAFLDDNAAQEDVDAFMEDVKGYDNVASVSYTSKDDAWKEYQQSQGKERADETLAALDGNNPLPASVVIKMNDPSHVRETAEKIRQDEKFLKVIDKGQTVTQDRDNAKKAMDDAQSAYDAAKGSDGEADAQKKLDEAKAAYDKAQSKYDGNLTENVSYGSQTVEPLLNFINGVRVGGIAVIVLLLFFSYTFISNIIHSAIESRSDEIAIMRLVGAPNKFIRRPFMAEGMLQALIGAAVAIVALALVQAFALPALKHAIAFVNVDIAWWQFMLLYLGLALSGAILGMLSASLSMRKYLRI